MKIIYEFDTDSEGWRDGGESMTRDQYESAFNMLMALDKILDKIREWYKYDTREAIPTEEIRETLTNIIDDQVPNIEKLRYG